MKRTNQLIFILIILIIALGSAIYFRSQDTPNNQAVRPIEELAQQPIKKPIVHYPISKQEPEQTSDLTVEQNNDQSDSTNMDSIETEKLLPSPLPEIQNSDPSVKLSLDTLLKEHSFSTLFIMESFIQRLVVTVDNLPEKKIPHSHLPIRSPKGKFIVSGTAEEPQTSSRNNKRYTIYIEILKHIDPELAVKVYAHYYPLFQKAYEQLGYKNAYFNDRLVFVLDHLLETPNPADPLSLVQPVVQYTYKNPDYENMSAGQKLLLRVGQENRTVILQILSKYRKLITGQITG